MLVKRARLGLMRFIDFACTCTELQDSHPAWMRNKGKQTKLDLSSAGSLNTADPPATGSIIYTKEY